MNLEESLIEYRKGQRSWNTWAWDMLNEKERLKESGDWEHEAVQTTWYADAKADFRGHVFEDAVDFSGFIFPADTIFRKSKFLLLADFSNAKFMRDVDFAKSSFLEWVDFKESIFATAAVFSKAVFAAEIFFDRACFGNLNTKAGDVIFLQTAFKSYATFKGAQFYVKKADFRAMQVERYFSLNKATFHHCVPDFVQAHFQEAPLLEHLTIPLKRPANTTEEEKKELPARYRALKRLALQGHDHEREQDFFAAELRSLRWVEDFFVFKNAGRWWGGLLYQLLSNFGRSIFLPFFWWIASIILFMRLYDTKSPLITSCAAGIDRHFAPLFLSLKHAFIALPTSVNERTNQLYACLYGREQSTTLIPIIPDWVAALGIVQTLFSAVVIFLFLLAVRAKFRIK